MMVLKRQKRVPGCTAGSNKISDNHSPKALIQYYKKRLSNPLMSMLLIMAQIHATTTKITHLQFKTSVVVSEKVR